MDDLIKFARQIQNKYAVRESVSEETDISGGISEELKTAIMLFNNCASYIAKNIPNAPPHIKTQIALDAKAHDRLKGAIMVYDDFFKKYNIINNIMNKVKHSMTLI